MVLPGDEVSELIFFEVSAEANDRIKGDAPLCCGNVRKRGSAAVRNVSLTLAASEFPN